MEISCDDICVAGICLLNFFFMEVGWGEREIEREVEEALVPSTTPFGSSTIE